MWNSPDNKGFLRRAMDAFTIASLIATSACAGPVHSVGEQENGQGGQNFTEQQYKDAYKKAIENELAGLEFEVNGVRAGGADVTKVSESLSVSGSLTASSVRISEITVVEDNGEAHSLWGVTPKTLNGMDAETFFLVLDDVGVTEEGETHTQGLLLKRVEGTPVIKPVRDASGNMVVAADVWSKYGKVVSAEIRFDAAANSNNRGSLVEDLLNLDAGDVYGQSLDVTQTPVPTEVFTVTSEPTPLPTATPEPEPTSAPTPEPTETPDMNELFKTACGSFWWKSDVASLGGDRLPTGIDSDRRVYDSRGGYKFEYGIFCVKGAVVNPNNHGTILVTVVAFDIRGSRHEFILESGMNNLVSLGIPVENGASYSLLSPEKAVEAINDRVVSGRAQLLAELITVHPTEAIDAVATEELLNGLLLGDEFPDTENNFPVINLQFI